MAGSDLDAGMVEHGSDCFHLDPGGERECRGIAPQTVNGDVGQPGL